MAYDNTNRWTLNKNTNKQMDTHADYNGKININGVEYWLNGWIKDGPNGKFISGTTKHIPPKEEPISQRAQATIRKPDPISSGHIGYSNVGKSDMDDDIPFAAEFR